MFAFTANTWQGGDYIPHVWDAWLADPRGAFVVGVDASDQALALGKLSVDAEAPPANSAPDATAPTAIEPSSPLSTQHSTLSTSPSTSPAEGWLEGIRVAAAARERGWGRALTGDLIARADALGLPVVRFITERDNTPVHRIAGALGFWREGEYHPHRLDLGGAPAGHSPAHAADAPGPVRRAEPAEAATLWEAVVAALAPAVPLRWRSWAAARGTAAWFAAAAAAGRVLVAADGRSLAVVEYAPGDRDADLALLVGESVALPGLLRAARDWAAAAGAARVLGLLPPPAVPAAGADGWEPYTSAPMWLYRRDRPGV